MSRPEPASMASPVRVVVCDDSPFMRHAIARILGDTADLVVVGTAADGTSAVELCRRLRPDVLTLDLELPDIDGVDVLQELEDEPVRVVVVSGHTGRSTAERAVEALAAGALDVIGKPGDDMSRSVFAARVLEAVRDVATGTGRHARLRTTQRGASRPSRSEAAREGASPLLVIGASTGGPAAIDALLGALPPWFASPVLIVQHMPRGFSEPFARRLQRGCALRVREAWDGAPIVPGEVLVAESGRHLHVGREQVWVRDGDPVQGMRPSIDVSLMDAASTWGDRLTAVVLTGIGRDGTDGARAVRSAGGRIIVEHESSCAVWGMPRSVQEAGLADVCAPLEQLPALLVAEAER
jgi:two-component system, chemotaxis family, protein-glutamate methylesterase/glutaminase